MTDELELTTAQTEEIKEAEDNLLAYFVDIIREEGESDEDVKARINKAAENNESRDKFKANMLIKAGSKGTAIWGTMMKHRLTTKKILGKKYDLYRSISDKRTDVTLANIWRR